MKRMSVILAAVALVLGLSQCKKEPEVIEGEVPITLDVKANNGSRIDVNTANGAVSFEYGDVVYVGSGGKFVGMLTNNGYTFAGNITNPTTNQPLYFFFLGNRIPEETLTVGTSTNCSVSISDQTSKLPVISFATSDQNFTGEGNYTAYFRNKAALVKFDVNTASQAPTCLLGMNNKVTVDFATNGFACSQEGQGVITLSAGQGEKWAILLPQASGTRVVRSFDDVYSGSTGNIPPIVENDYLTMGIEVNVNEYGYVDLGLPSHLLWATCNVGATSVEGYGDYFAWGETEPKDIYDYSTYKYCNGSNTTFTKYCNKSSFGYNGYADNLTVLLSDDDAATVNWGNGWRMPTKADWEELDNNTDVTWTQQNGVNGRLFTAKDGSGNSLFMPAAGLRADDHFSWVGDGGYYWSSSLVTETNYNPYLAYVHTIYRSSYGVTYGYRDQGHAVRAVRSPQN